MKLNVMKLNKLHSLRKLTATIRLCALTLLLVMSTLIGCQSNRSTFPSVEQAANPSSTQDPAVLLQQAKQAASPYREQLMLQAAQAYLDRRDYTRADRLLNLLRQQNLSSALLARQQQLALQLQQSRQEQQRDLSQDSLSQHPTQLNTQAAGSPQKIAVLLAESGRYQSAAAAIRQGILLAYYQQAQLGSSTELVFFDSTSSPAEQLYQQALAAGANVIIGPLDKDQVKQLANLSSLTVPVLALNYLPESTPVASAQLFQFGLAAEDEARQISQRGQQLGYRRAALLYPQNEWGQRVAAAFREHWRQQDGLISSERAYPTTANADYTDPVKSLLGVHKETGSDGQAHQVRRQDIDFIVMISDAKTARQLKPMLNYYFADNLPVLSTSSVFANVIDPSKDQDINQVQFTELPWLLDTSDPLRRDYLGQPTANSAANSADTLRLVALGIDSWRLALRLHSLQSHMPNAIEGATGKLTLNPAKRIQRQAAWAQFQNGRPVALNVSDSISSHSLINHQGANSWSTPLIASADIASADMASVDNEEESDSSEPMMDNSAEIPEPPSEEPETSSPEVYENPEPIDNSADDSNAYDNNQTYDQSESYDPNNSQTPMEDVPNESSDDN